MSTNNLLEPGNHALLLIDHQYLQLLTLRSHEASQVIGNVTAVAKGLIATASGMMVVGKANPDEEVLRIIVDNAFAGLM